MKSMFKGALSALTVTLALSGLTAASALAAGAPIVETKLASSIAGTEVNLNGTMNPNGGTNNSYYFEYGTTTSYGSTTSKFILGNGNEAVNVSKTATGLALNTTYHYRIVATNSYGTSYGSDKTFKTLAEKLEFVVNPGEKLTELKWDAVTKNGAEWSEQNVAFNCSREIELRDVVTGPNTVQGTIRFTGCRSNADKCQSVGAKEEEEIVTEELTGTLVYISKAAKTVGILFKPKGESFTEFRCVTPSTNEIHGGIIVPITPVNTKLTIKTGFTLGPLKTKEVGKEKEQEITEYETNQGTKVRSRLETYWIGEHWGPLSWSFGNAYAYPNKEFEIQA